MAGASVARPWADHPRADAKDWLLKYALEYREGTPVICAVRDALNSDAVAGDADHRLALRFYREHSDLFKTDRQDGLVWVWPDGDAFHSTANNHSPKHADYDGVSDDMPKCNARNALARRRLVESDGGRGYLLGALATYRETTEDRFHRLDRVRGSGPEHLLVPYVNRFNSPRRVGEARERFAGAFDRAGERFDRAVMVTLTTDPNRFDSLLAATESLMEDVNRFKSWLATGSRLGSRPPSIVVPEFTESGLPHVHVVLFGVSWVVPHKVLSAYWAGSRDRAEVVWFDRLASRGRWQWANRDHRHAHPTEDVAGRSPRAYLSKSLDALDSLAGASPEAVREASQALLRMGETDGSGERMDGVSRHESAATDGPTDALACGREWWKLALYWTTDMRLFTLSPSLKPSNDDDGLPHIPSYEYVGTARLGEFPGFVQENAVILTRKRSTSTATGGGICRRGGGGQR